MLKRNMSNSYKDKNIREENIHIMTEDKQKDKDSEQSEEQRIINERLRYVSKDSYLSEIEKEQIKKSNKEIWNYIMLKEDLLKRYPEEEHLIECAYIKYIYMLNKEYVSEKEVYNDIKNSIFDSFIHSYKLSKPFALKYPISRIVELYPMLKKQVYAWANALYDVVHKMVFSGESEITDDEYEKYLSDCQEYFPRGRYMRNEYLCVYDLKRERIDNTFLKSLNICLDYLTPLLLNKMKYMNYNSFGSDIEFLAFVLENKDSLSSYIINLSPKWDKNINIESLRESAVSEKIEEELDIEDKKMIIEAGIKAEKDVDYVLSWIVDKNPMYRLIEKKSVSEHTNMPCIKIRNESFRDEVQEIDHILVSTKGVFLIETKNIGGFLTIDSSGNWIRTKKGETKGILNPTQQVGRHEALLKSILGNEINIQSIICVANERTVIEGQSNCTYPVIKSDLLDQYISNYNLLEKEYLTEDIDKIVNIIDSYLL